MYPNVSIKFAGLSTEAPFTGVPDLMVQLLDKLVDNAVDFTPEDGEIRVSLAGAGDSYLLTVVNTGSRLPDSMQNQLFESMVSVRNRRSEGPHLGFGLFIVRLIADFHGGVISAHDLPDNAGVEFSVELPRAD